MKQVKTFDVEHRNVPYGAADLKEVIKGMANEVGAKVTFGLSATPGYGYGDIVEVNTGNETLLERLHTIFIVRELNS